MKTPKPDDEARVALSQLVRQLQFDAREQKRRVTMRLHALQGGFLAPPSRGPLDACGRVCVRWHFWTMARRKHARITKQITALCSLTSLPNAEVSDAKRSLE